MTFLLGDEYIEHANSYRDKVEMRGMKRIRSTKGARLDDRGDATEKGKMFERKELHSSSTSSMNERSASICWRKKKDRVDPYQRI